MRNNATEPSPTRLGDPAPARVVRGVGERAAVAGQRAALVAALRAGVALRREDPRLAADPPWSLTLSRSPVYFLLRTNKKFIMAEKSE